MAVAFRSLSSVADGSRANTTGAAPAGAASGDLLVAVHLVGGPTAPTVTGPTGWTKVDEITYSAPDPWAVRMTMWTAPYGVSNWTWTHASGNSQLTISAYTGVDTSTPMDVTAAAAVAGALEGLTTVAPSLTTVTASTMGIIARGSWDGAAISPPAGWTERHDSPVLWVGEHEWTATGATGTVSLGSGNGGASSPWGVMHAALRPAGTGSNSGTLAASLPRLSGSIAGTQTNPGTLAASTPRVSSSLAGTATNPATLSASLPRPTGALTGQSVNPSTLNGTLPGTTGGASGSSTNPVVLAVNIPKSTGSLSGTQANPASLAGTLPPTASSIADQTRIDGTLTAALTRLAGSITGTQVNAGTMSAALPRVAGQISDQTVILGTLSATLPRIVGTAAGQQANPGSLTGSLAVLRTAPLSGSSTNPATLTATLPTLAGHAAATLTNPGALAGVLPLLACLAGPGWRDATTTATDRQPSITALDRQPALAATDRQPALTATERT